MVAIPITRSLAIDSEDLVESFTRASGPGGQHVNTTDSAVALRFDVANCATLPDRVKRKLTELAGSRMTRDGVLVIQSDLHRSQLRNRQDARDRLIEMIRAATKVEPRRRPTKPTKASQVRRVEAKQKRGGIKSLRRRPID